MSLLWWPQAYYRGLVLVCNMTVSNDQQVKVLHLTTLHIAHRLIETTTS